MRKASQMRTTMKNLSTSECSLERECWQVLSTQYFTQSCHASNAP